MKDYIFLMDDNTYCITVEASSIKTAIRDLYMDIHGTNLPRAMEIFLESDSATDRDMVDLFNSYAWGSSDTINEIYILGEKVL